MIVYDQNQRATAMKPGETERTKQTIERNAAELTRLHRHVHLTFKIRNQNRQAHEAWERACAEFHARYDELAFPGGYERALTRIAAGDPYAIETAICFLEVRPRFFHSGTIYQRLLRLSKNEDLRKDLKQRLEEITGRPPAWRQKKQRETRKSA